MKIGKQLVLATAIASILTAVFADNGSNTARADEQVDSIFPTDLYAVPRSWTVKAYSKLIHFNKLDKGGHFAAWEQPELLSKEFRTAFKSPRGDKATALNQ